MGGRYTATTQGFFKKGGSVVLAVAHPWASASSYLSSQSVADSRCHLYAAPRSSYPRRSRSCRFFLTQSSVGHMSRLLPARPTLGSEADFAAPSSDDVNELGRSRGSQMTSHTSIIGHGRRKRGGGRWKQHRAPLATCHGHRRLDATTASGG